MIEHDYVYVSNFPLGDFGLWNERPSSPLGLFFAGKLTRKEGSGSYRPIDFMGSAGRQCVPRDGLSGRALDAGHAWAAPIYSQARI